MKESSKDDSLRVLGEDDIPSGLVEKKANWLSIISRLDSVKCIHPASSVSSMQHEIMSKYNQDDKDELPTDFKE